MPLTPDPTLKGHNATTSEQTFTTLVRQLQQHCEKYQVQTEQIICDEKVLIRWTW